MSGSSTKERIGNINGTVPESGNSSKSSEGRNFRRRPFVQHPLNLRSAGLSAFAYEPAGMILTPTRGLASPPRFDGSTSDSYYNLLALRNYNLHTCRPVVPAAGAF